MLTIFNKELFGKRIKDLRIAQNVTQETIANTISLSFKQVSALERGFRAPSIEVLVALAELFCVSVDYLIGKSNVMTSNELLETAKNRLLNVPSPQLRSMNEYYLQKTETKNLHENIIRLNILNAEWSAKIPVCYHKAYDNIKSERWSPLRWLKDWLASIAVEKAMKRGGYDPDKIQDILNFMYAETIADGHDTEIR